MTSDRVPVASEEKSVAEVTRHVGDAYDRWAVSYDRQENRTRDLDGVILRAHGPDVRARRVLELGCGTGKNTAHLAERAEHVTALDLSEGMLAVARARITAPHVHFVRHDLRVRWPVADAAMDVVIGNLVLEHLEDLTPIFTEAARVLRADGTLYLSELHPMRQWLGAQAHFTDAGSGAVVHVPAFRHTVAEYVNGGLAAGFTVRGIGEWREDEAPPEAPPRLLTVRFTR